MNTINQVVTQNAVHLNQDDMDGLFSIARYGIKPLIDSTLTIALVDKLVCIIAQAVAGQPIARQIYPTTIEEENALDGVQGCVEPIFQGEALLVIMPMPLNTNDPIDSNI